MTCRRAFTLLEILVVCAIMGIMVSVGVVSITAGQGAARVRGAARDVFAAIRQARSTALVTMQPAIITYSTSTLDGEPVAKVEISSTKLLGAGVDRSKLRTVTGYPVDGAGEELVHVEKNKEPAPGGEKSEGETLDEILFAPVSDEVFRGMRIKVLVGDDLLESEEAPRKPGISIFSNVDYLLGRYKEARKNAEPKERERSEETSSDKQDSSDQEPVSVVWETNGRVEPHQVYVYPDGKRPEQGLLIRVDRFGAAKVVSGDGREDD